MIHPKEIIETSPYGTTTYKLPNGKIFATSVVKDKTTLVNIFYDDNGQRSPYPWQSFGETILKMRYKQFLTVHFNDTDDI